MCGIFGTTLQDSTVLHEAVESLAHRGPDARGLYSNGTIAFGHLRLAILDLNPTGAQPMMSEDENFVLIFNGEIYNFQDLRTELLAKGYTFKSTGDTEVILKGYQEYGKNFFGTMRGMWALALYDKKQGNIVLSRDHFGIKPLYYTVESGNLFFASELKALKKVIPHLEPNTAEYYQFFHLGYFCAPSTCYQNVFSLQASEIRTWNIASKTFSSEFCTLIEDTPKQFSSRLSVEQSVDLVEQSLLESIEKHFIADVPVGLLLSGGNDSSLIAAMSHKLGKRPTAYHVEVENSADTYYAKKVAEHLKIDLVNIKMDQALLQQQYEKIWNIVDQPFADISVIPTSLIYSCIDKKTKVVLSGEGGDELFGGYLRHKKFVNLDGVFSTNSVLDAFNFLGRGTSHVAFSKINPAVKRLKDLYLEKGLSNDLLANYLKEVKIIDYPFDFSKIRSLLCNIYENKKEAAEVPAKLFFDLFVYLANNLMYKNDIASMASSIEARVPFLDRQVFGTVMTQIPHEFLLSQEYSGKFLLKKVLERYLPSDLVYRSKKGFGFSFKAYENPTFQKDAVAALNFHFQNSETFGITSQREKNIFRSQNYELLLKKYPRFVFGLISNTKIWE